MEEVDEGEGELDLDLGFLVFFAFLALACFFDLFLDCWIEVEATGTEPRDPPKAKTGPRTPAGIRGTKGLGVSWMLRGGLGVSSMVGATLAEAS